MDWKNRFLNLGGRITLLKSILSSLAIFTMSFYKMPVKVVREFSMLQAKFLWGGVSEKRSIHWVSWKGDTLPYLKVGLNIKDLNDFNLALLNKWSWRIANGGRFLWIEVLKARYGDINMYLFGGGDHYKI